MLLRFDQFMSRALYDGECGYYTQGPRHVGKDGDFFTSVSVGALFGSLLCRRFFLFWDGMGRPDELPVIEMGANDGRLACDILDEAGRMYPDFAAALRYTIIEPLAALHPVQKKMTGGRVRIVSSAEEAASPGRDGIVFGNELLDAFPVRMAVIRGGRWHEQYVRIAGEFPSGECSWEEVPLAEGEGPPVSAGCYGEGYLTEWVDDWDAFWKTTMTLVKSGLFLFLDYGRNEQDYYTISRSSGTLRTYYRHTRTDDPLIHVGEQDITVDVNFTAVAEAAQRAGAQVSLFADQAQWLTTLAKPWLLSLERDSSLSPAEMRKAVAQFQTLTHPSHMGTRFHVLELSRGKVPSFSLLVPRSWERDLWG